MKTIKIIAIFLWLGLGHSAHADEVKTQLNGLTLNGDLILAEGKSLKDGVVLFTHGTWMHNNYSTAEMLKNYLPEMGVNVLAINLSLGTDNRHDQAMISCDQTHTHKHTDAIKEIDAWVQWLKKESAKNITIAGHSRGGNQTAWYAAEHNDESAVKNVVLIAPQLWNEQKEMDEYQKKYHKDLKSLLTQAEKLVAEGKGDTVMKNTDLVYCKDSNVTAASFADYYQVNPNLDTLTLLPQIKKPVLVISGTEDTVVQDLAEKLQPITEKHSNISGYEIEDADHFFLDFAGEEVSEQIKQFIK